MNTKQIKNTVTITVTVPVTKSEGPGRPSHLTKGEVLETMRNALNAELTKFFVAAGFATNEIPGRLVRIRVEAEPQVNPVAELIQSATATPVAAPLAASEAPAAAPKKRGRPRKVPVVPATEPTKA